MSLGRVALLAVLLSAPGLAQASPVSTSSRACGCGGPCTSAPKLVRTSTTWAVLDGATVRPIRARTATAAAEAFAAGSLTCGPSRPLDAQALLPVDGSARGVPRPVLAPKRGVTGEGDGVEADYARVLELASLRVADEDLLPLEVRRVGWAAVPGGAAEIVWLDSPLVGGVAKLVGPVLRLGASAPAAERPRPREVPAAVGRPAMLRTWIDAARARPRLDRVDFEAPGGRTWARDLVAPELERADRSDVGLRLAVSHGIAAGFGAASILVTIFDEPECRFMCDDTPPLGFDGAYLDRFRRRAAEDIRRDRDVALALDISIAALALSTVLVPTARHGVLSRWEILEDAIILSEGVVVAYTTPLSLEARLARARPIAHHPVLGAESTPRTRVGPPFMSYAANRSGAWIGGVLAMLISEDAPWAYTLGAGLGLGALAATSAYFEVRAGLAYPSDIPLSLIYGAINGAGTYMWHRWFWGGWPGSKTGDQPLRLRGMGLVATPGGGAVTARLSF